jgi:hypothetical protein
MRAGSGLLIATAMLGAAGLPAVAQTAPGSEGACGSLCRFFSGQWVAPTPPQAPVQGQPETAEAADPPRKRVTEGNRRKHGAAAQEHAPAKARKRPLPTDDVEQTSSVSRDRAASGPRKASEIVLATGPDDAHAAIAADLTAVLSPEILLRTAAAKALPLKHALPAGADLAIASSLTLARGSAVADKLVYVSKLFTEELHAVAAPGVRRLDELQGKPVYLGPRDSDSEVAARTFLERRGVTVAPVGGTLADALKALRQRRVAAVFVLAPKPFAPLTQLSSADAHLLPLAYDLADPTFHPASLSGADYPGLVRDGARIETVALDAILVAPRWRETAPRNKELAAFAARFFDRIGSLAGIGRHPKWQETNLAAQVENLTRFKAAQQWVATRLKISEQASAGAASTHATESR